jgi:hypothetical protein
MRTIHITSNREQQPACRLLRSECRAAGLVCSCPGSRRGWKRMRPLQVQNVVVPGGLHPAAPRRGSPCRYPWPGAVGKECRARHPVFFANASLAPPAVILSRAPPGNEARPGYRCRREQGLFMILQPLSLGAKSVVEVKRYEKFTKSRSGARKRNKESIDNFLVTV